MENVRAVGIFLLGMPFDVFRNAVAVLLKDKVASEHSAPLPTSESRFEMICARDDF